MPIDYSPAAKAAPSAGLDSRRSDPADTHTGICANHRRERRHDGAVLGSTRNAIGLRCYRPDHPIHTGLCRLPASAPQLVAIAVICLAFGGTAIGWFGALIWALQAVHQSSIGSHGGESGLNIFVNDTVRVKIEPDENRPVAMGTESVIERLARLKQLADQGVLDAEEYAALRKSVLASLS